MIIPEDNKGNAGQPQPTYGSTGENDQAPSGSRSQQPLFRRDDVESQYDPPPLYSESTPLRGGEKGRRRSWRVLLGGSAVVLALIVLLSLRKGRSPYGHPPGGPSPDGPKHGGREPHGGWPGPDAPPSKPGKDRQPYDPPAGGDGAPSDCADYSWAEWHELPGGSGGGRPAFGANLTWTVDTEDLFTHIFGIAGDIAVNAYSSAEKGATQSTINVQAVIRTRNNDFRRSSAWDRLMSTDVCQGERQGDQHGRGVVVNAPHDRMDNGDELSFRITVSLPVNMQKTIEYPFIAALDLRTPVGDVIFTDVTAVNLYNAYAATSAGDIVVHNVRAREIELRSSTGDVRGRAAASSRLIAQTNAGSIDLDVQIPKVRFDPNDMMSTFGVTTSCDRQLKPVEVTATTHSGDVTVRYDEWEDPCRRISHESKTDTGDIKVFMNPLFEGPFKASTGVGSIKFDSNEKIDDPLGTGRRRHTRVNASGSGRFFKTIEGVTFWDGGYQPHPELPPWQGNRTVPGALLSTNTGDVRLML